MAYFQEMFSEFLELPPALYLALITLVVGGVTLLLLMRRHASKGVLWGTSIATLVALALLLAFAIPQMQPESAEDGGLSQAAGFLYQSWFYTVVFVLATLGMIYTLLRKVQFTARMLATAALCVAAGLILSYIRLYRQPNGGSVTPASMLPILMLGYFYGPGLGFAAGLLHGMIQLFQGAYIIHPAQFLLDYLLPFAMLGVCGFFRKDYTRFIIGVVAASLLRAGMHFLAGWVFWGSAAPAGQHPAVYSLLYTAGYMLPEIGICVAIILVPPIRNTIERLKRTLQRNETR